MSGTRFDPPAVSVDHMRRLRVPAGTAGLPAGTGGLLVDREGGPTRVRESDPPPPPAYLTSGSWISNALDSGIEDCQWHRIELCLGQLPAGTRIRVLTHTEPAPRPGGELAGLPDELWDTHYAETGAMQPPNAGAQFDGHRELLVQSHCGALPLAQDRPRGRWVPSRPPLDAVRVHYPRESYLSYLPAVYSADDDNRWFLERFLSIFQTEWDELQRKVATSARFVPWFHRFDLQRLRGVAIGARRLGTLEVGAERAAGERRHDNRRRPASALAVARAHSITTGSALFFAVARGAAAAPAESRTASAPSSA